jgi:hypothetical protein
MIKNSLISSQSGCLSGFGLMGMGDSLEVNSAPELVCSVQRGVAREFLAAGWYDWS